MADNTSKSNQLTFPVDPVTTQIIKDIAKSSGSSGVSSITAGTGISVSGSTGSVTVNNSGVLNLEAGSGIQIYNLGSGNWEIVSTGSSVLIKSGSASHSMNSYGSQTIAHGLGKTPAMVRINASFAYGSSIIGTCYGTYNGTTTQCAVSTLTAGSGSVSSALGFIIDLYNGGAGQTMINGGGGFASFLLRMI